MILGRFSPSSNNPATLLQSSTLATGAAGTADSAAIAPAGATVWTIAAVGVTAPSGTDGAVMIYRGSKLAANLLSVISIGDLTSVPLETPLKVTAGTAIILSAVGIPALAGNTVIVNLLGQSV